MQARLRVPSPAKGEGRTRAEHCPPPKFIGDSKSDYHTQTATVLFMKKQVYNRNLSPQLFTVIQMLERGK